MAGKGGGAWKVAYADFVTAMMAFFLVMWIMAQNKPVKEAIAKYFTDPYGTSTRGGKAKPGTVEGGGPIPNTTAPNRLALSRPTLESAPKTDEADRVRAPKPTLPALHDQNKSTVGFQVPFAEDSSELDDRARQTLDKLIPELQGKLSKIEIRGHASGRVAAKAGGPQDAWQMSYARALATLKYLAEKGIAPNRVRLSQSGVYEPLKFGNEAGLPSKNARVDIYELNELADDPTATRDPRTKGPKKPEFKRAPRKAPPAAAKAPAVDSQSPEAPSAETQPAETPSAEIPAAEG